MCKCSAVECRMLTYLQSSRVRLESTCWVLCGHTALDGIAIDPYLVLFQAQLVQTATFTHSQLSVYQIHTGWKGERETETVVILHLLNNKNTPCHRPHSHNDHIQHWHHHSRKVHVIRPGLFSDLESQQIHSNHSQFLDIPAGATRRDNIHTGEARTCKMPACSNNFY